MSGRQKIFMMLSLVFFVSSVEAKVSRHSKKSLIELGPKASLYIGDDVSFGLGAEIILNPLKNFGFRLDFTEVRFGKNTSFYLNNNSSIDGFLYIPMREIEPYLHAGFGFSVFETQAPNLHTFFTMRAGIGFNYPMKRGVNLFFEPGIVITGNGATVTTFRLSLGGRFGGLI